MGIIIIALGQQAGCHPAALQLVVGRPAIQPLVQQAAHGRTQRSAAILGRQRGGHRSRDGRLLPRTVGPADTTLWLGLDITKLVLDSHLQQENVSFFYI